MDTLPLDQKFLHLLIYRLSEPLFLGTTFSEENVITYAKLKGIYHDILVQQYQKLEGLTWDQFDEVNNSPDIKKEVRKQVNGLINYFGTIEKDHRLDDTFQVTHQDLENRDFFNFYYSSNFSPLKEDPISFEKYQERSVKSLEESINKIIEPIIRLNLLKTAQNKRVVESKVYFRKTWDDKVSELYRFLSKKLDTNDVNKIQEHAELNYFIERYQRTTMDEYRRLLYGALKQVKHRKS